MNKLATIGTKKEEVIEEKTTKICEHCYSEINIKATKCPHCTSNVK
jgi:large conductance mechanosensitive channel